MILFKLITFKIGSEIITDKDPAIANTIKILIKWEKDLALNAFINFSIRLRSSISL